MFASIFLFRVFRPASQDKEREFRAAGRVRVHELEIALARLPDTSDMSFSRSIWLREGLTR